MNTTQNQATPDVYKELAMLNMKTSLATLWTFRLFNVVFKDIHEFFRPGFLDELMTGTMNGNTLTEEFLFAAAFAVEIPILMIVLAHFLPYRLNRWTNIIIGVVTIISTLAIGAGDLDDMFFVAIELATLAFIIWMAWRWRK